MSKRSFILFLNCVLALTLSAQSIEKLLLDGWRFHQGAAQGAEQAAYDDSQWQEVSIPHDWAISGPFDKDIDKQVVAIMENGEQKATEKTGRSGSLPWVGEGWYRTVFEIPEGYTSGELVFDGAMAEPHVWVDGQDVGYWAFGYNVFRLKLGGELMKPGRHTLAVHLQNVEESSRWYPGAGIYRPVRLVLHKEVYIDSWETFVRTTRLDGITPDHTQAERARLTVSSIVESPAYDGKLSVTHTLLDASGKPAGASKKALWKNFKQTVQTIDVDQPLLWSPEHPVLYTLVTEVHKDNKLCDRQETKVGIRLAEYNQQGFFLNGEQRKFRGVCLHHDMGPTGTAFYKDAFRRQVRLLKEIGCDAIRTSHNTPCPWQLDICDEMGMMVMAESFDMWKIPKCKNGYARFFDETDTEHVNADGQKWYLRDISNLVRVNRNHPSIVMWSIGNEVPEQSHADGLYYSTMMQDLIHRLDGTRPCTQGMNSGRAAMENGIWQTMDIPGWNYHVMEYPAGEKASKSGIIVGSETASTISSRGVYKFPVTEEVQTMYPDGQVSSYDLTVCHWSNLPDDDWVMQDLDSRVIGEFVWTGFDYLGEPTPYDEYWPSRSSYFGIYDLAGLPKDRVWLYRTHWAPEKETLHILPHWTWKGREGEVTPVFVYTNYPEAELFVNGVSQGRRKRLEMTMDEYLASAHKRKVPWGTENMSDPASAKNRIDRYRLRWMDVVYEPGEIRVVAYDRSGKPAAEKTLCTAGKPHHIVVEADRTSMPAQPVDSDGKALDTPSLTYYTVNVVDRNGNLCPDASNQLSFKVDGASARFNSCCNGDATSLEPFTKPTMKAFHGKLVVVVESTPTAGTSKLTVTGKGLKEARTEIVVTAQ